VAGSDPAALDPQRHVGAQPDRDVARGRVGGVPPIVGHRPRNLVASVVGDRLADQLHLDPAVEALDRPHQHVLGVVVGRRTRVRGDGILALPWTHRERVADHDPAVRRPPGGDQDVRPRLVDP
jgi:hypothetical protein